MQFNFAFIFQTLVQRTTALDYLYQYFKNSAMKNQNKDARRRGDFLEKLQQIVEDSDNESFIEFDKKKGGLIIPCKSKFQEEVLPRYFHHSKFSSFSRQLYWFGFRRVKESLFCQYANSELKKGVKLTELKSRRKYKSRNQRQAQDQEEAEEQQLEEESLIKSPGQEQLHANQIEANERRQWEAMSAQPQFFYQQPDWRTMQMPMVMWYLL